MLKLNNKGISHLLLPLLVITVVAVGGVYMIVASHANGFGNYGSNKNSSNSNNSGFGNTSGGKKAKKPAGFGKFPDAGGKVPKDRPEGGGGGNSGGGNTGGDGGPAATAGAGTGTVTITNPPTSKASSTNPSKPSGDIIVVTYVDDPAIDKKGDKDHRIGGVKVKVEKTSGNNNCDNRKSSLVKTNQTKNGKTKSGKPVLIHGTAHLLSCDTGSYKATLIGRSGYEAVSPKVRTFNLKDNETEAPYFVIKKKVKKPSTSNTTTTPNQANGDATGTGGAQAP